MVIEADDFLLKSIKLLDDKLQVQFVDGKKGKISLENISVGSKISEVESGVVDDSGGERVRFVLENGENVDYPWDFFRRLIDEDFQVLEKKEAIRAREQLGEKVCSVRKQKSLTQQELAERSGLDRTTISRIERGTNQASFDTLHHLAGGLQVPIQELVMIEDESIKSVA